MTSSRGRQKCIQCPLEVEIELVSRLLRPHTVGRKLLHVVSSALNYKWTNRNLLVLFTRPLPNNLFLNKQLYSRS